MRPDALDSTGTRLRALPSLTAARWWAAGLVFIIHALVFMPVYPFQKSELFRTIHGILPMQVGSAGVTFFFLLSGFIIYWSNHQMSQPLYYVSRRLLKLFPTHLITALLFIAVVWNFPWQRVAAWLPNFLLIHTWVPEWSLLAGLDVPSWSLASELLFYVSFPLLLPLIRRIPSQRLFTAVLLLFVAIVLLHLAYYLFADGRKDIANTFVPLFFDQDVSPPYDVHAAPSWFLLPEFKQDMGYFLTYYFPLSRLPEFFLGVLGARAVIEGRWRNTATWWPALALVAAVASTWVLPINFKMSVPMLLPVFALICTFAVRDLEGRSGVLMTSPLAQWAGNISFALYLVQFPVMAALQKFLIAGGSYGFWGWLGFAALAFVISIALSDIIFRFVDDPLMNAYARWNRRRSVPAPSAPAPSADTASVSTRRTKSPTDSAHYNRR